MHLVDLCALDEDNASMNAVIMLPAAQGPALLLVQGAT